MIRNPSQKIINPYSCHLCINTILSIILSGSRSSNSSPLCYTSGNRVTAVTAVAAAPPGIKIEIFLQFYVTLFLLFAPVGLSHPSPQQHFDRRRFLSSARLASERRRSRRSAVLRRRCAHPEASVLNLTQFDPPPQHRLPRGHRPALVE